MTGGKDETMTNNYLVVQRYYDSGRVGAEILHTEFDEKIISEHGYVTGMVEDRKGYTLYVDAFATMDEAEQFRNEALGI